MSLMKDPAIKQAFDENLERQSAYFNIRTLMRTAFAQTRGHAVTLTSFLYTVEARNTWAYRVMDFCLRGTDAKDQRVVNAEQQFQQRVHELETLRDKLEIEVSSVVAQWRGIQALLEQEAIEWKQLGRKKKGMATRYANFTKALKVGMVALAVFGVSAIVMCLLGAEIAAAAGAAVVLGIAAELLGILACPVAATASKKAKDSAERFAALAQQWRDGSIAAKIIEQSYDSLLEYASCFADCYTTTCEMDVQEKDKKEVDADWKERIKDPAKLHHEWIMSGDKAGMEVVKDEIQASLSQLQTLAKASSKWQASLSSPESIVVGRATE